MKGHDHVRGPYLRYLGAALILLLVLSTTSCLPGDGAAGPEDPAGFFSGIWHGWMAPVSLIVSIFRDKIAIYEPYNTGFWYDFAYYIAILGGFGGFSLARNKKKKEQL